MLKLVCGLLARMELRAGWIRCDARTDYCGLAALLDPARLVKWQMHGRLEIPWRLLDVASICDFVSCAFHCGLCPTRPFP